MICKNNLIYLKNITCDVFQTKQAIFGGIEIIFQTYRQVINN